MMTRSCTWGWRRFLSAPELDLIVGALTKGSDPPADGAGDAAIAAHMDVATVNAIKIFDQKLAYGLSQFAVIRTPPFTR